MVFNKRRWRLSLVAVAISAGVLTALLVRQTTTKAGERVAADRPTPEARRPDETEVALRFYTERVRRDPEETRSQNALAELYLQRVHDSGNEDYLPLALSAARASLAIVDEAQNLAGLTALAHAEFANHDFAAARNHAEQLAQLRPQQSEPHAILGDASLELGDYARAVDAFQKMEQFGKGDAGTETRLARLSVLRGDPKAARQHLTIALGLLRALQTPPRTTIAWCHWQLGEIAFASGDFDAAERDYRAALTAAPEDFRTLGSLARLEAARGDLRTAVQHLERAVRIAPSIDSMGMLGDLYQLSGRLEEAVARYELVAQLGEHSRKVHGSPFNRALTNFFANHDLKSDEAYALAASEFAAGRHDVYGADALAWCALKANRLEEAQRAIKEALKLGTLDARLFYHAGMIARAAEDRGAAAEFLERALKLNPGFDPLQSRVARHALEELRR